MAEETRGLKVVEEKTILFYEDELVAVKLQDGTIYVPVRRLCDNLGLTWPPQFQRIQRDEVLSEAVKGVIITITPSAPDGRGGGPQEALCLPLDLIPGWLFGIQTSRVREEIRDKLIRYRRECFRVLWDAFKGEMLPELQEPKTDLTPAEQTLVQAEALYNLARQQVAMERWLMRHDRRLDEVEEIVEDLCLRVQGPERLVTDEQAAEIATVRPPGCHASPPVGTVVPTFPKIGTPKHLTYEQNFDIVFGTGRHRHAGAGDRQRGAPGTASHVNNIIGSVHPPPLPPPAGLTTPVADAARGAPPSSHPQGRY